jgi:hypothetical protein
MFALGSALVWAVAHADTASPAPVPPQTCSALAVEVVKAVAWPLATVLIVVAFRRALAQFFQGLGSRIHKLSIFDVELELVPASPSPVTQLIDRIREPVEGAEIQESSGLMNEQLNIDAAADYVLFSLGEGSEWLTSRLYLAVVMMQRMRRISACVFVEAGATARPRFVALATVDQLRWAMVFRYPWLEATWVKAQAALYEGEHRSPGKINANTSPVISRTGRINPYEVDRLTREFVRLSQTEVRQGEALPVPAEWVSLRPPKAERAAWVTSRLLADILPQSAFDAYAPEMRDEPRARLTRAVLRRSGPFVALVGSDQGFSSVTNRPALLE